MPKPLSTLVLDGNLIDQHQHQGKVFVVLNGDPTLFGPISDGLRGAGFTITPMEGHWFRNLWRIQRANDAMAGARVQSPGAGNHPAAGVPLKGLVDRFKAQWGHLASTTRTTLDWHFKVAARYLDFDRDVTDIRLADMRVLKSKLSETRKPASVNDILFKGMAALFNLAVDDDLIEKSPMERLKHARHIESERIQPTWDQSEQIINEIRQSAPETALIVRFMRDFGVGQGEIKSLTGEHIDVAAQIVHFRRKKTGKPFDVPIYPHAKKFIERLEAEGRLQNGKPVVSWRNPRRALATACEHLGLPDYGPRSLRRCFIVHCLQQGIDPRVVARWQGHKDAKLIFSVYGKFIDAGY